jgi:hypothetical protein
MFLTHKHVAFAAQAFSPEQMVTGVETLVGLGVTVNTNFGWLYIRRLI